MAWSVAIILVKKMIKLWVNSVNKFLTMSASMAETVAVY